MPSVASIGSPTNYAVLPPNPPSDNTRNGTQSPVGDSPGPAGGRFPGLLSGVLPGPVLVTFVGAPGFRSRSYSSPSLFSSANGTDGSTTRSNFFRNSVAVPDEYLTDGSKEGNRWARYPYGVSSRK